MAGDDRLARLEALLRELQDIEAIETLKARYWRGLDRKQPDDVEACLAADVVVDFEGLPRYASRAAFMQLVRPAASRTDTFDMHHGQNPRVTLTGADTAEGEWDIFYCGIDLAAGTLVQMAGAYTDTYRRQDGRWVIATTAMRQTSLQVLRDAPPLRSMVLGRAGSPT